MRTTLAFHPGVIRLLGGLDGIRIRIVDDHSTSALVRYGSLAGTLPGIGGSPTLESSLERLGPASVQVLAVPLTRATAAHTTRAHPACIRAARVRTTRATGAHATARRATAGRPSPRAAPSGRLGAIAFDAFGRSTRARSAGAATGAPRAPATARRSATSVRVCGGEGVTTASHAKRSESESRTGETMYSKGGHGKSRILPAVSIPGEPPLVTLHRVSAVQRTITMRQPVQFGGASGAFGSHSSLP